MPKAPRVPVATIVSLHESDGCTPKEIAARLGVSRQYVAKVLKRLEDSAKDEVRTAPVRAQPTHSRVQPTQPTLATNAQPTPSPTYSAESFVAPDGYRYASRAVYEASTRALSHAHARARDPRAPEPEAPEPGERRVWVDTGDGHVQTEAVPWVGGVSAPTVSAHEAYLREGVKVAEAITRAQDWTPSRALSRA